MPLSPSKPDNEVFMRRAFVFLVAASLSMLTPGSASAQERQIIINGQLPPPPPAPMPGGMQAPARDASQKTGTARIRGRVVAADTGLPLRMATTNDIGEYRIFGLAPGQYFLSATLQSGAMMMMADTSDDRSGYAPTYYPGTPDASQAQRITIGLGQAVTDINLALVPTRTARISGTAVDSNG